MWFPLQRKVAFYMFKFPFGLHILHPLNDILFHEYENDLRGMQTELSNIGACTDHN